MASWQDGAEYAPIERPDGFATPKVAVLPEAPPLVDPAAHQPIDPPHVFEQRTPAVPLEALVPVAGPTRDPHQAFTSGSMVSSGAWGAAHADGGHAAAAWTPDAPLLTSSSRELRSGVPLGPPSGRPVGAATFAPPQGAPVAPGRPPVRGGSPAPVPPGLAPTGTSMWRRAIDIVGWPPLVLFALGAGLRSLAFVMLLTCFLLLTTRNKVVGQQLSRFTILAAGAALLLGLIFPSGVGTWDSINGWARWGCLAMVFVSLWVGYRTLTSRRR